MEFANILIYGWYEQARIFSSIEPAMLKDLNTSLIKNEVNKERCRRQAKYESWRESAPKDGIEEFVLSKWVDFTGE